MYHSGVPPLVAGATTFPPSMRGHYKAPLYCELLMKALLFRALLSHRSAVARELDSQGVVDD